MHDSQSVELRSTRRMAVTVVTRQQFWMLWLELREGQKSLLAELGGATLSAVAQGAKAEAIPVAVPRAASMQFAESQRKSVCAKLQIQLGGRRQH